MLIAAAESAVTSGLERTVFQFVVIHAQIAEAVSLYPSESRSRSQGMQFWAEVQLMVPVTLGAGEDLGLAA